MEIEVIGIDVNEILEMVIKLIIVPLLILGIKWLGSLIKAKIEIITDKRARETIFDAYVLVEQAVMNAVYETEQIYVDELKSKNEWDAEAMKEASKRAFIRAKELASDGAMELITSVSGNVDEYIQSKIEGIVWGMNK